MKVTMPTTKLFCILCGSDISLKKCACAYDALTEAIKCPSFCSECGASISVCEGDHEVTVPDERSN